MSPELTFFFLAVALSGIVHVLLGPDHYLPLIACARTHRWSSKRTCLITLLCGIGHILSSVLIGSIAVSFRFSLHHYNIINSVRGDISAWLLIALGGLYFIWGLKNLYRRDNQTIRGSHWVLFLAFIIGPCEPLFFIATHPIVSGNITLTMISVAIFSAVTVATMLGAVMVGCREFGLNRIKLQPRFTYVLPGLVMMLCGIGIKVL